MTGSSLSPGATSAPAQPSETGPNPATTPRFAWIVAATVIPATSAVLYGLYPEFRHWFLIPITVSGVLIGVDAFGWLGRGNVFDPQSILGIFGLQFYYFAPILHVIVGYWPPGIYPDDPDWRNVLGAMAVLNAVGLAIYRVAVAIPWRRPRSAPRRSLDERRFLLIGAVAVGIGVAAFLASIVVLGGPAEYYRSLTTDRSALVGLGALLMIGESFPLMLFAVIVVRYRASLARHAWWVALLLVALLVTQVFVGGLRGSRATLLWPTMLGLIMIHYLVRPITRKVFVGVAVAVIVVTFGYGLYKSVGAGVVDIARGTQSIQSAAAATNRGLPTLLLGDLGRSDIQAVVLERATNGDMEHTWGSTYLSAPLSLIPRTNLESTFPSKSEVGTDVLLGPGSWDSGERSQRVFGITGEALINFGIIGGLLSFAVLGLYIRFARRYSNWALAGAALGPRMFAVVLSPVAVLMVLMDVDNLLLFLLTKALPVLLVTWLALDRSATEPDATPDPVTGDAVDLRSPKDQAPTEQHVELP